MFFRSVIILILSIQIGYCAETCSRKAIVNYQEILVDGGSNKKGEGLRFYLEKDKYSKELLDKYQGSSIPKDQTSLCIQLIFQSTEKTLVTKEIDEILTNLFKILETKYSITIRI